MSEPMILEVLKGKDARRRITVPTSGAVLGRDSDFDISLDEPTLSGKHCRIVQEKTDWVIRDLDSASGVIINGQKTNSSHLKQGSEIKLGLLRLKVVRLPVPQVVPAPDTIRFKCKCGKVHAVKAAFAGKTAVCKQCGAKTKVPRATGSEDTIRFTCKCRKVHTVKATFAGKMVVCKQCGVKLVVPAATASEVRAALGTALQAAPWIPLAPRLADTERIDLSDIPPATPD